MRDLNPFFVLHEPASSNRAVGACPCCVLRARQQYSVEEAQAEEAWQRGAARSTP